MTKIKVAHILHCVGGVDVYLRLILENTNPELIENIVIHGINDTTRQFYDQNNKDVIHYKTSIFRKNPLRLKVEDSHLRNSDD